MTHNDILAVAQVCHEANRAYCKILGDLSQPSWELAPDWQKESACLGVQRVLEDPVITPEQLHESWVEQKVRGGWKYGPEKNPALKTHPCMVPYAELPELQRKKDALFRGICQGLLFT